MAAETARRFKDLGAQAETLLAAFEAAGYERVAPAILQPADVYLDAIGEELRSRTYVFTDLDGNELCLRPDLTVPTCRLHLDRGAAAALPARYCYNGPAFRFQPGGATDAQPREFRQAGLENFGAADAERADAEVLAAVVTAVGACGLAAFRLRTGDIGLFAAVLAAVEMPERWRDRLYRAFWRPGALREMLAGLRGAIAVGDYPAALLQRLRGAEAAAAPAVLAEYLAASGIPHFGTRTLAEVADSLRDLAADYGETPLSATSVAAIAAYLDLTVPVKDAAVRLRALADQYDLAGLAAPLARLERRIGLIGETGVALEGALFDADFGRSFEYYTGFVFELEVAMPGRAGQIAGGGRYDGLVRLVGGAGDVPAVGAAIHTERLLAATSGGGAT
jgi:ATP phosphoribosyltransferase regulatory subunit